MCSESISLVISSRLILSRLRASDVFGMPSIRPASRNDKRSTTRALNIHLSSADRSSMTSPRSSFMEAVVSNGISIGS